MTVDTGDGHFHTSQHHHQHHRIEGYVGTSFDGFSRGAFLLSHRAFLPQA
jgi:hypothetical protein